MRWLSLTSMKPWAWMLLISASCLVLFYVFLTFYSPPVSKKPVPVKSVTEKPVTEKPVTVKGVTVSPKKPWIDLGSQGPCKCAPGSAMLKKKFPKDEQDEANELRKETAKKHKARTKSDLSKVLLALPNSPLQYPIHGVSVKPLKNRVIPGLALYAREQSSYKVTLKVSKGVLSSTNSNSEVTVEGNGKAELTLMSSSLQLLNTVLETVSYTSTIYHVNSADFASFSFENHEAMFPIVIRQPPVPVMFPIGANISSQVTVTVKTFLRYDNLRALLKSIRNFYPKIPVIIADDSFEPEQITGENIQQYFMPPAQGWFAGRNLAISQVTTKYFLWADDDFVFTKDTQIEKMVEVMEAFPELDVVGGGVQRNRFHFTLDFDEGDESEGGCLTRRYNGRFHELPGYPQCFLASGVVNFFLARTDVIQKSRFDPLLKRVAHSEWFMDGLGSMMVASCSDVSIGHQPSKWSALYRKYRMPPSNDTLFKYHLHFLKNNLKCVKY